MTSTTTTQHHHPPPLSRDSSSDHQQQGQQQQQQQQLTHRPPAPVTGGLRTPSNRKTIYDRNLNRTRTAELSRASFAYLFSEMVTYAQKRVTGIQDLEKRFLNSPLFPPFPFPDFLSDGGRVEKKLYFFGERFLIFNFYIYVQIKHSRLPSRPPPTSITIIPRPTSATTTSTHADITTTTIPPRASLETFIRPASRRNRALLHQC